MYIEISDMLIKARLADISSLSEMAASLNQIGLVASIYKMKLDIVTLHRVVRSARTLHLMVLFTC
jgi:hypothetical protein